MRNVLFCFPCLVFGGDAICKKDEQNFSIPTLNRIKDLKSIESVKSILKMWLQCHFWAVLIGVVSRAGPGSGIRLPKCDGPISGLHTKLFYNIQSNDFFLSWSAFVLFTVVFSVNEVIVIFLQLILFANTAAFFCSLLGLVSHSFWQRWENQHAMALLMALRRRDQSFTRFWAYFKKRWPTNPLFMPIALSYIVSFMPIAPSWIISW